MICMRRALLPCSTSPTVTCVKECPCPAGNVERTAAAAAAAAFVAAV